MSEYSNSEVDPDSKKIMEKSSEELLWAIKNGELNIVKDVVEKQVHT